MSILGGCETRLWQLEDFPSVLHISSWVCHPLAQGFRCDLYGFESTYLETSMVYRAGSSSSSGSRLAVPSQNHDVSVVQAAST